MSEIIFATEENLKKPSGGLIVEEPQPQDHVLGGLNDSPPGPEFDVLVEDGHWAKFAPVPELQRVNGGDTFMCVSFSNNNIHEFLMKRMFDENFNFSDVFLGVGSGTQRGRGNSKRAVAEFKRLSGFVSEGDYPLLPEMSMDEVYKPLTKELLAKGIKGLDQLAFSYKWLPDNGANSIREGLKYSPVQVDVLGSFPTDKNGYIIWDNNNPTYCHEVCIFDYEEGKCWWVFDSELMQFTKFAWNYPFGSPMIHALKKNMKIQIFKEKGKAALAVKTFGEPSMIAFSGGNVIGETLFKSLYGVSDFKSIPITEVDKFPFPVKHLINTNPA